jgi:hypothetical protein
MVVNMTTALLTEYVMEAYRGEVMGESYFNAWLADLENLDHYYKTALMLQLEGETKLRLRPVLFRHGLHVDEETGWHEEGRAAAGVLAGLSWADKMASLQKDLITHYLPAYQKMVASTPVDHPLHPVFCAMVDHETVLLNFVNAELAGKADHSATFLINALRFPLERL